MNQVRLPEVLTDGVFSRIPRVIRQILSEKKHINIDSDSGDTLTSFDFNEKDVLGSGDLSIVMRAEVVDGKPAAAKLFFPRPEFLATGDAVDVNRRQFLAEADILRKIQHPNIVKYFGSGVIGITGSTKIPVIVRELVPIMLSESIAAGMSTVDVITMARQISSALTYLAAQKIIVTELNPTHIGKRDDGSWVLVDLNLVSVEKQPGEVAFDVQWSAPEIQRGKTGEGASERSEVYSLALVIYRCLGGAEIDAMQRAHLGSTGSFGLGAIPGISESVMAVLKKGCSPNSSDRYSSLDEFIDAFDGASGQISREV